MDKPDVYKLIVNLRSFELLNTLFTKAGRNILNGQSIFTEFIDLEKEMKFGKTELPVYKVYGLEPDGSGKGFEYLGSPEKFRDEKSEIAKDVQRNVMVVKVTSPKKTYATTTVFVLSDVDVENDKYMYNEIAFRSNQSATVAFVVEGTKSVAYEKVDP